MTDSDLPLRFEATDGLVVRTMGEADLAAVEVALGEATPEDARYVPELNLPATELTRLLTSPPATAFKGFAPRRYGIFDRTGFHGYIALSWSVAHESVTIFEYWCRESSRGRRIISRALQLILPEARRAVSPSRFEAQIDERNVASRSVLVRLGFTCAGTNDGVPDPDGMPTRIETWVVR